jgi:glycine oxidase
VGPSGFFHPLSRSLGHPPLPRGNVETRCPARTGQPEGRTRLFYRYNETVKNWDVIISGAGIIGISLALELRRRGARVLVLDRGEPGSEASSAAAGMLADADPETPKQLRLLATESAARYPRFVKELEDAAAMKVDFRHGSIALFTRPQSLPEHEPLLASQLRQMEPAVDAGSLSAYLLETENSVNPELLMQAALRAARASGIEIHGHTTVHGMTSAGSEVEVVADDERRLTRAAVNCQGAWAGVPVRPRKGQMLYLKPQNPKLLNRVVRTPEVYLVPRSSGKILAGATLEDAGFDKSVNPETIAKLHRAAAAIVPELRSAPVVASWAGLRPGTPDDLPILGRLESSGVFIAGGHFRNGILLAPITATIMADLIEGRTPAADISAFSPGRFNSSNWQLAVALHTNPILHKN